MAMSDEERRNRAAVRARERRARERADRGAAYAAARDDARANAGREMRDAVEASISAAKWLTASDGGVLVLMRQVARIIDEADHVGDVKLALAAQGRLSLLLSAAGLTPAQRLRHELRSSRAAEPPAPDLPGNVSRMQPGSPRPRKRDHGESP